MMKLSEDELTALFNAIRGLNEEGFDSCGFKEELLTDEITGTITMVAGYRFTVEFINDKDNWIHIAEII